MSIVSVSVIAVGSASLGFLAAALLSAAKQRDVEPPRQEQLHDPRLFTGPSQN
jgi:hypothetical protein